ncbi:MAG: GDSL-type esterase/lipase family protein [Candidatus Sericytochromatia bacterium]|nr:GDSL-type esterase/lipase family protein [Candidatus Sericytochromatia bacterium]
MRHRLLPTFLVLAGLSACGVPPGPGTTPRGAPGPRYGLLAVGPLTPRAVTASSTYGGLVPGRAIDGDVATQWSNDGYRAATASLVLDHGQPCAYEQLRVKTGVLPAGAGYVVETSEDQVTWAAASGTLTNTTWTVEAKALAGTGRYLRLRLFNSPSAPLSRFSVFEVQALGRVLTPSASPSSAPTSTPPPSATPTATPPPSATPLPSPTPEQAGLAPAPNTPVALGGRAVASRGDALAAFDGLPLTRWQPGAAPPQWFAVPLTRGASGPLLCAWDSVGYTYVNVNAAPRGYAWEASGDSTTGRDGTWTTAFAASDTPVRSRNDTVVAPGARWLRLRVDSVWGYGPDLRGVDVQQTVTGARANAWLILGDSITAQAFDPAAPNAFPDVVARLAPGLRPMWTGGGTGGDTATEGLSRLAAGLNGCPPRSYVGLAYGTNDATRGIPVETFRAQLDEMVGRILASGRTPMLARCPWSGNGAIAGYVRAIDAVAAARQLRPGPDLYSWFQSHPEELQADRVHPTAQGRASTQRLWGEAVARAYGY